MNYFMQKNTVFKIVSFLEIYNSAIRAHGYTGQSAWL